MGDLINLKFLKYELDILISVCKHSVPSPLHDCTKFIQDKLIEH